MLDLYLYLQEDEIPLAVMAGRMKKFSENSSTIPEVMDYSTLNFNPNFKFSRFFLGGGPPSPFGCVLHRVSKKTVQTYFFVRTLSNLHQL